MYAMESLPRRTFLAAHLRKMVNQVKFIAVILESPFFLHQLNMFRCVFDLL